MRNKPRDVTGGSEVWGGMIPGYGLAMYVLGWFSVPIETFLRRDFGERYYTRSNFIAGFFVMVGINMVRGLVSSVVSIFSSNENEGEHLMWTLMKWYLLIGICHFVTIWIREVTGTAKHSYDSGRSWLLIVGRLVIGFFNLLLGLLVKGLALALPPKQKAALLGRLPMLRSPNVFTERFIEPFVVFILAMIASAKGETAVSFWLLVSFAALNMTTGARHQNDRAFVLDMRDQMLEARAWRDISEGRKSNGAERLQRTVEETVKEVEKTPEILEVIQEQQPSLAKAIAAIQEKRNI